MVASSGGMLGRQVIPTGGMVWGIFQAELLPKYSGSLQNMQEKKKKEKKKRREKKKKGEKKGGKEKKKEKGKKEEVRKTPPKKRGKSTARAND